MSDSDTVKLLRECNSGIQMAVFSIDEILEKVTDKNLYEILKKSKEKHEKLGDETHAILAECGYENQYAAADDAAMKLTDDLIRLEEKLRQDLREYL